MRHSLVIYRCLYHPKIWAIMLDDDDGGGVRLTPGKCCGQWRRVVGWNVTPELAEGFIEEFSSAMEGQEASDG